MEIKKIDKNDSFIVNQLVKIEEKAFGEGALNYWGLIPMIYHGAVYAVFVDKTPVGLAEYMRDMKEVDKVYLYSLAIKENYQKQGLASNLLDYSLKNLKEQGIKKVELTVSPENESALHLYQRKFSFSKKDYRKDEYGKGEDRLIMELKL